MKRMKLLAMVAFVALVASATVMACGGGTEVQTVVVERVVTQAPEVVVQTVEVPVEREVTRIETVEVEVPVERVVTQVETVEVEVERVVTQVETVEVERVVTQVETVVVEVTAEAMMTDDAMMSDEITRDRQLILLWGGSGGVGAAGRYTDHDIWNIYNPGTSHQNGPGLLFVGIRLAPRNLPRVTRPFLPCA